MRRMGSDDPERMASLMGHVKNRMNSRQSDRVTSAIMVLRSDANEKRRQVGGYRRVNWAEKAAVAALMIDGKLSRKAAIKAYVAHAVAAAVPLAAADAGDVAAAGAGAGAGAGADADAPAGAADLAGPVAGTDADADAEMGGGDVAVVDPAGVHANDMEHDEAVEDVDAQFALNLLAAGVARPVEDGLEINDDGIRALTGESDLPPRESGEEQISTPLQRLPHSTTLSLRWMRRRANSEGLRVLHEA